MAQGATKSKRSAGPKARKPFELQPLAFRVEFPGPQSVPFRRIKGFAKQVESGDIPMVIKPVVQKLVGGEVDEVIELVSAGLLDPVVVTSGKELEEWVAGFKRRELARAEKTLLEREGHSGD